MRASRLWRKAALIAALACVFAALPATASANLVGNGSFESGYPGDNICGSWWYSVGYSCNPSNTSIPGWLQTGGGVDWHNNTFNPAEPAAQDGVHTIDLIGNNDAGAIEQAVPTTPGATYNLSFWYAGHPFCIAGNGSGTASATAAAGTSFVTVTSGPTNVYTQVTLPFTGAAGSTTTISFTSLTNYGCGGVLIDDVSVDLVTPADPAITASPTAVSRIEGDSSGGLFEVAKFSDPDPLASAGEYTATINWGDGSPTEAGTIGTVGGGNFDVAGAHTYAEEGSYSITVTITDSDNASNTATVVSPATIYDASLNAGPLTLGSAVEGSGATSASFAFTDNNPSATAADFTATIDWGDSTTSAGTVSGSGGSFTVSGSHAYADEGSYTVTVTVVDDGGSTTLATGTANVADAPLTAGPIKASCTNPCTATFAFTDANASATVADFAATINWGDSTSSAGTVSGGAGSFTVTGTHLYADDGGGHAITITVTDDGGSSVSATAPAATGMLLATKSRGDDEENGSTFRVVATCSSGTATATINGVPVKNGDIVRLKLKKSGSQKVSKGGRLTITATSFQLVVTCADSAGNVGCTVTQPVFGKHNHDEDEDEYRHQHDHENDHYGEGERSHD